MTRLELLPAYGWHVRAYRDTSLLVELFSESLGRVTGVADGARQRKSRTCSLLNPSVRLRLSLQGKSDLKLITHIEADEPGQILVGKSLYSGLYLNEILMRLLPEQDAHPELFLAYQQSLGYLQKGVPLEPVLRSFELTLLTELGYVPDLSVTADTGQRVELEGVYFFEPQRGLLSVSPRAALPALSGKAICHIAARDFSTPETRQVAKYLCRQMLAPLLGSKPLKSRELFLTQSPKLMLSHHPDQK